MRLQETGGLYERTPAYLWNNLKWELKTVTTEKSADSALRSALKQIAEKPGGVILDYGDNEISIEALQKIIDGRLSRQKMCSADIMILNHGRLVKVIRYKK